MKRLKVFILLLLVADTAYSGDLSMTLRSNSRYSRVGDSIIFTFTYTNNSGHDLGILPEFHTYEAADIQLIKYRTGDRGEMVPYVTMAGDHDVDRKDLHVLKPGQTYVRKLKGKVSLSLPAFVTPSTGKAGGLYLLFVGSAIKLPGFGTYKAVSEYVGSKYLRSLAHDSDQRLYWLGRIKSSPIMLEFRER